MAIKVRRSENKFFGIEICLSHGKEIDYNI